MSKKWQAFSGPDDSTSVASQLVHFESYLYVLLLSCFPIFNA